MPENLKPALLQSHAQTLREEAGRRLSRSPHPYHRQHFELPHASERISTNALPNHAPLHFAQSIVGDRQEEARFRPDTYRDSTNSDSGTEADDEHFLKGLPAPKLRSHKGLRGSDGTVSNTPSPLLSPVELDEENQKTFTHLPDNAALSSSPTEAAARKLLDSFKRKRQVEIVRRVTETAILGLVAVVLCQKPHVVQLLRFWQREISCQFIIIAFLLVIYPLRKLPHLQKLRRMQWPTLWVIPASFDPAPLLYPLALTMMVSLLTSIGNPPAIMPALVLSISSLPKHLTPDFGQLGGYITFQWLLSMVPIFLSKRGDSSFEDYASINKEILSVLCPLHQALCETIYALTTTSLLPAELQLLSVALVELLLLASSPQTIILKALLWGGGIGVLITCDRVLRWGVALARVPKWRFRRSASDAKPRNGMLSARGSIFFKQLEASFLGGSPAVSDSSDDNATYETGRVIGNDVLRVKTRFGVLPPASVQNTPISATELHNTGQFEVQSGSIRFDGRISPISRRRHTLPSFASTNPGSGDRTSSGRRKRATSSTVQAFFSLTQGQAALRKWIYAAHVYSCVLIIIFIFVREYIRKYSLHGNEPVGWALGYLFGDLPRFRMEVVKANLQRWVCLPPRNSAASMESCRRGWVEHIRHSSIGQANTRLILCAYWLSIIVTGLAVVFRLSAIYEVDTRRKVFHFMMVAMLLPATYIDPAFAALALGLMLAIFLLLDLFRASQLPPLSKSLAYFLTPYVDGRDLKGPVVISHIFLLIGCAIPLWLSLGCLPRTGTDYLVGWEVPTREVSMVSGVICVGMGDAAASLIGRRYGRHKWVWGGGKSIEGSVAFALAVGLALVWAKIWLRFGAWEANNNDTWGLTLGKTGLAAGIASLTEAVLTGGNDNVVVPVVLWICVKGLDI